MSQIYNPRRHRVLIVNKRVLKVRGVVYHKGDIILLTAIRGQVASLIQRGCLSRLSGERLTAFLAEHPELIGGSVENGTIMNLKDDDADDADDDDSEEGEEGSDAEDGDEDPEEKKGLAALFGKKE